MINKTEQEIMKKWKGDIDKPLVSVCCITYNHENYITEALDSFLMQETDFCFEVIVRDDASLDKTADIIREYESKYPKIIKPIYEKENGYQKGIRAFPVTFAKAKGEYIALCEGDDYWTDIDKLQIQKEFLEKNKEYSAITHQVNLLSDKEFKKFNELKNVTFELNDLLFERKFHTASILCRGYIIQKNSYPSDILSGDKALIILLAIFGKIYFDERVMGIYRKHDGGMSSWVTDNLMMKDLNIIPWILKIDSDFPKFKLLSYIHKTIVMHATKISIFNIFKHSFLFIFYSFSYFPLNVKHIASFVIKVMPSKIGNSMKVSK